MTEKSHLHKCGHADVSSAPALSVDKDLSMLGNIQSDQSCAIAHEASEFAELMRSLATVKSLSGSHQQRGNQIFC